MAENRELGLIDFVKAAFKVQYNLILLGGAVLAGLITIPTLVLPVVAATELLYLASLSNNERFRRVVRLSQEAKQSQKTSVSLEALLKSLSRDRQDRFINIRNRCMEIRGNQPYVEQASTDASKILEDHELGSVDKLLWIFLRTLYYEQVLSDFLSKNIAVEIGRKLDEYKFQLERKDLPQKTRESIAGTTKVLEERLANVKAAQENLLNIRAKLEHVENTVLLIQEQSLTRRDPEFIEVQIQSATAGLDTVKEAMRSLDVEPSILEESETPMILRRGKAAEKQ